MGLRLRRIGNQVCIFRMSTIQDCGDNLKMISRMGPVAKLTR